MLSCSAQDRLSDQQLRILFDIVDTDKSGTVDYNEFRHGLSMLGFEPTDAQVKAPEIDFHTNSPTQNSPED